MALTDTLVDIGDAIREKDGSTGLIPFLDMPGRILAIPSGGGAVEPKDVNFYDYDGTLVAGWTLAQARTATSLPGGPTHERLVFQGWNWTLAQTNALTMPMDVGAMYTTVSGASEFDMTFTAVTGTTQTYRFYNNSGTFTIDYGDGEIEQTVTTGLVTFTHDTGVTGSFIVSVDSTGTYYPYGSSASPYNMFNVAPNYTCTAVRFGDRCTSTGNYAFRACYSIRYITLSLNIANIGSNAFYQNYSLTISIIPPSVASIGASAYAYDTVLIAISLPPNITSIPSNVFLQCYSITRFAVPASVMSIGATAFSGVRIAKEYFLHSGIPPTLSDASAFTGINDICIIYVPPGSLAAYQSATNWATYADYMREWTE